MYTCPEHAESYRAIINNGFIRNNAKPLEILKAAIMLTITATNVTGKRTFIRLITTTTISENRHSDCLCVFVALFRHVR